MKEKPTNLNSGVCFSIKWKATCQNGTHLDEEKQFGLKSHLRACCTQPFNYNDNDDAAAADDDDDDDIDDNDGDDDDDNI